MKDEKTDTTSKSNHQYKAESTRTGAPTSQGLEDSVAGLKPDTATDISSVSLSGTSPFGPEVGDDLVDKEEDRVTLVEIRTSDFLISISGAGIKSVTSIRRTVGSRVGTRTPKLTSRIRTDEQSTEPALHVQMCRAAYEKLRETVGTLPAERGGVFVGRDPFCIEDFIFDRGSEAASAVYYPDAAYLNEILERDHEPFGRRFVGVAHSHPTGFWRPSGDAGWGDIKAARNNLISKSNQDLPALFIPIIESVAMTGRFVIHPFVMVRDGLCLRRAQYEVIDEVNRA